MASKTYRQVLRELPVDELLRDFLGRHGVALPEDIEMSGGVVGESSDAVSEMIGKIRDHGTRERIDRELVSLLDYKGRTAQQSVHDAIACDRDACAIFSELEPLAGAVHRALSLQLNHPGILSRASGFFIFDSMQNVCGRLQFEEGLAPALTEQNRASFCGELSDYYLKNQACGKKVTLEITERKENRWHFHILISSRLETEEIYDEHDEIVPQSVRHPLHVSFEYSSDSGIIEITERNFKLRNAIVKAFARHYLGKEIDPYALPIPDLNLKLFLAEAIESPVARGYQVDEIQVQRLELFHEDDGAMMSFAAKGKDSESVYAKIGRIFEGKAEALKDDAEVNAVTLKFHLPKWQGSFSAKGSFCVTLKKKAGIGWGRLSETEKDKVLDILADIGAIAAPPMDYGQAWDLICRLFRHDSSVSDATARKEYPGAFECLKQHGALVIGKDRPRAIDCPNCGEIVEIIEDENGAPFYLCGNCLSHAVLPPEMLRVWKLRREWLLLKIAAAFGLPPRKHEPASVTVLGEYDRHAIAVAQDIDLVAHNKEQLTKLHEADKAEPWVIAPSKPDCNPAGMRYIPFEESFKFSGNGLAFRDFTLNGLMPNDARFPVHGGFSHDYMWHTDKVTGKKTKMTPGIAGLFRYMRNMPGAEAVGDILRGAGLKGTSFSQYFQGRSEEEKERKAVFDRLVKQDEDGKYYLAKE